MGSPSAPKPPNPRKVADAQTGQNVGTALANQVLGQVNQQTPFGSLTYNQTGSTSWTDPNSGKTYELPQFTATQQLSRRQQELARTGEQAQINMARLGRDQSARLGSLLGSPLDVSGAPGVNAPRLDTEIGANDFERSRGRVEKALLSRMNPDMAAGRERLEAQLTNQGIARGSEAWKRGIDEAGRQENDARMGAILAGGQEQSRLFGMERDQAAFGNAAMQTGFGNDRALRSDYMTEAFAQRNQPINEIASLLGGSQVTQPNFVNTPSSQMANTDMAGIYANHYNQQMQRAQQQNQLNPWMQALYGAGQTAASAYTGGM
jgi:hypothetical protein